MMLYVPLCGTQENFHLILIGVEVGLFSLVIDTYFELRGVKQ